VINTSSEHTSESIATSAPGKQSQPTKQGSLMAFMKKN
jgi:hypothetical protein